MKKGRKAETFGDKKNLFAHHCRKKRLIEDFIILESNIQYLF